MEGEQNVQRQGLVRTWWVRINLRSCVWATSDGGFGEELREGKAETTYWRAMFTTAVDYGLNSDSGGFRQRRPRIRHCWRQGGGWDEQGRVWAREISDESIENVQKGFPVYLKTLCFFFLRLVECFLYSFRTQQVWVVQDARKWSISCGYFFWAR